MHTTSLVRRLLRRAAAAAPFLAVAVGLGCGPDPFAPKAYDSVIVTEISVWAITGSPAPYPTAIAVASNATARLEPTGSFDFAFDITPGGDLQVLPMSAVVTPIAGPRSVGIQVPGLAYADIASAPRSGYAVDSIVEVGVGEAFIVRVTSQNCAFSQQQDIFAKFVVDSLHVAERRAFLSGRINPNCGFRSFADGIPEF